MSREWTNEQAQVIRSRGENLLVAAAAGSGKTAVLVERLLSEITEKNGPDLDALLVVTFTNEAAAQLRGRIRETLAQRLREEPDNAVLRRQMSLLAGDHIMTVHGFCNEVIRNHFNEIGIDPGFRIAGEGELRLIKAQVLAEVIEEAYAEGDADFAAFSESFARGKDDRKLEALIEDFYRFSEAYPEPAAWRHECLAVYEAAAEGPDALAEQDWMRELLAVSAVRARDLMATAERALTLCGEPGGPWMYAETLQADIALLQGLGTCGTYEDYAAYFARAGGFAVLGRKSDKARPVTAEQKERVKLIRDGLKKEWKSLAECFASPAEELAEEIALAAPSVRVLVALADRFEEQFRAAKDEKRIIDYADLEHGAIRILTRRAEDGGWEKSEAAREMAEFFREVCVDEYQDSNPVQELILQSVSGGSGELSNRFMVGDVKQSIYRFRLATPEIFMEKYNTYPVRGAEAQAGAGTETAAGRCRRIDLHKNFRSRPQVLEAVNTLFYRLMRREIGGIEYGEAEALVPGAAFPEDAHTRAFCEPEIILADERDIAPDESRDAAGKRRTEAGAAADRILGIVGREPVRDAESGQMRPARYGDIVILLRSAAGWSECFSEVLTARGIPVTAGTRTGYFEADEVRTVLAFLQVLDNPRQDIPLASVLRSPIGGLSDSEMALLRIARPEGAWYDCMRQVLDGADEDGAAGRATEGRMEEVPPALRASLLEKLRRFDRLLTKLRARVSDTPVHQLLWMIFDETGYADMAAAMPGGARKRGNLDMLVQKAIEYEATSYRGLFHFVRYIENMKKSKMDFGEADSDEGAGDAVRIMTIHASKGLEFPIVFVCGLGKHFNKQDARSSVITHARLGIGVDRFDMQTRLRWPLLIRRVLSRSVEIDAAGEELRVLYVAMTRAMEKLILTGYCDSRAELLKKAARGADGGGEKLAFTEILNAPTYMDWILMALADAGVAQDVAENGENAGEAPFRAGPFRVGPAGWAAEGRTEAAAVRLTQALTLRDTDPGTVYDEETRARLQEILAQRYAHPDHAALPGKLSVSELKKEAYEAEMEALSLAAGPELILEDMDENPPEAVGDAGGTAQPETAQGAQGAAAGEGTPDGGQKSARKNTAEESAAGAAGGTAEAAAPAGTAAPRHERLRPRFATGDTGGHVMTGALAGTALHHFLSLLDFGAPPERQALEMQLETMRSCDKIQKDEEAVIRRDLGAVAVFLNSELGQRMRRAAADGTLRREQPFVIGLQADQIRPEWDREETVLIQGIIDAYFEASEGTSAAGAGESRPREDGQIPDEKNGRTKPGIILVDYKTDRARPGMEASLVRRYRRQFELYARALEQLTHRRVSEMYLYSFALGKALPVTREG